MDEDDFGPIPVPGPYEVPSPRQEDPIPAPAPHEIPSPRTETVAETVAAAPVEVLADTGPAPADFLLSLTLILAGVALVVRARLHPQH